MLLCGKEVFDIYRKDSDGTAMRDFLNGTNGPFQKLGSSYATAIRSAYNSMKSMFELSESYKIIQQFTRQYAGEGDYCVFGFFGSFGQK